MRIVYKVCVVWCVILAGAFLAMILMGCATPVVQNARNYNIPTGTRGEIVEGENGDTIRWETTLGEGSLPLGWIDQSITQTGSGTTNPSTSGRLGASVAAGQNTQAGSVEAGGTGDTGTGE